MGGKQSSEIPSRSSLNPTERKRLSTFLEKKGSHSQFNRHDMERLWTGYLVPDLLKSYSEYLMKQAKGKQNYIGIEEFVWIYSALIRGDQDEKVNTLADVIGSQKNSSGQVVISFKSLCKYIADLLESYLLGLKTQNDPNYNSWTHHKKPERAVMELVTHGICSDLQRQDDEVQVSDLQRWLHTSAVVAVLHSYVLGSLYSLEPEVKDTVVPQAVLPTIKTHTFLDLAEVIYINSFIPNQHRTLWRFLFSTQTHGESFAKFIGSISNKGALVIVIQAENHCTFGGFISENVSPGPRWVGDGDCFLFRLSPVVEIFPSTGYNDHYVYLNSHQQSLPNGLGMGGQYSYWGLWLDSQFGVGECSESCTTYKDYKMMTKKKKFRIVKLEAWGVGDPPLTAHERGERETAGTTVLDRESDSTHLLEMAGRKMYSKRIGKDPVDPN
uniref:MTOR-associated protein MEAK7 n=1 Tax=Graphocephala atropunctata TaxID=36148 RepID=A0A1B6KDM1_9HEMI